MSDVAAATIGKMVLSVAVLAGVLYAVNRGASVVSSMTTPPPKPDAVGVPMAGVPGLSTDMRTFLANEPVGRNNSVAPNFTNGDAGGLIFDDVSLYQQLMPVLPGYVSNVASMM